MARNYHLTKIEMFRKMEKGRRLCHICLKQNRSKNMFAAARRGTC